ncbi:hypothetical protein TNCV_2002191 [Trichonephila clavipes]|nr:hypothetical protein TNCV_2002191 [Trichonephila clavipes]
MARKMSIFSTPPLFDFNKNSKATKTVRDICAVYGESDVAERTIMSLSNAIRGALLFNIDCSFNIDAEVRTWLHEFYESKPRNFYQRGIENFVEHWKKLQLIIRGWAMALSTAAGIELVSDSPPPN